MPNWWGTAIGGALGGVPGALAGNRWGDDIANSNWLWGDPPVDVQDPSLAGGDRMRGAAWSGFNAAQGREAPQAGRTVVGDVAQMSPEQRAWRERQMALADRLQGVASGEHRGAGELAAQRGVSRGLAAQQSLAQMQRGGNAALGARQAARTSADIAGQGAGQMQQAALQDQASARAQLAGVLQGGRGADIQVGLANMNAQNQQIFQQAGLDQATSLANMQSRLQTMGMNDQAALAYLAQLFNIDLVEMQARVEAERLRIAQRRPGMAGDILASGGQIGAALVGRP